MELTQLSLKECTSIVLTPSEFGHVLLKATELYSHISTHFGKDGMSGTVVSWMRINTVNSTSYLGLTSFTYLIATISGLNLIRQIRMMKMLLLHMKKVIGAFMA